MAKTHYGPNGERQFQWYSPETASAFPAFLDSAGTRPFFLWVGRLFEVPRARIELYDLDADPWELHNVADKPAYAKQVRRLAGVLQQWMEQSGDFPAAYRVRDDNTDRVTGVQFNSKIPSLRNTDIPPPDKRWGQAGPTASPDTPASGKTHRSPAEAGTS